MADTKISALTAATTPLAGTEVLPIVQSSTTKKVAVSDLTAGRSVSAASITASSTSAVAGSFTRGTSGTDAISFSGTSGMTGYLGSVATAVWIGRGAGGTANLISFDASASNIYSPDQSKYIEVKNTGTSITGTLSTSDNIIQGTAAKGVNFTANTGAAGMTSQLLNWYEEGTFTPTLSGATTTTYTTQTGRYTRIGRQVFFQCELDINSVGNGSTTIALLGDLPTAAVFSTVTVGFFNNVATSVVSLTGYIGAAGGNSVQFQSLTAAGTNTTANAIFQNGARVIFSGQYSA